jgi:hypothetical protein
MVPRVIMRVSPLAGVDLNRIITLAFFYFEIYFAAKKAALICM